MNSAIRAATWMRTIGGSTSPSAGPMCRTGLILTGLYQTPALHDKNILRWAAGGWQIGVLGNATKRTTVYGHHGSQYDQRVFRRFTTAKPHTRSATRGERAYASALVRHGGLFAPAQFTFGNSPRSGLRGDSLQTVDLTLSKEFPVTERYRLEMRSEFYNLLNHANFELPGHVLGAANFGTVLSDELPERFNWVSGSASD